MASNALTHAEEAARAPAKVAVTAGSKLAAFVPQSLEEAWRLSGALAASGMTPKAYGQDQNKIMVGILAGAEVGLTPFAALQSIAVIGNNPSLWGDGMLGLVEASGMLEDFEETDDGNKATCRAVRKGRPTPIIRSFSMDDAKKAGLAGKSGPWSQYPARMRQMRARSIALRDGFSDVLKGLKSAEEVRDYAPMDGGTLSAGPQAITAALIEQQASDEPDASREGRADTEMGEANTGADPETGELFTDDEHPAFKAARNIVTEIEAAQRWDDVGAIMAGRKAALGAMPKEASQLVYDAQDVAKARLMGSTK